jgi:hypothetical protein
MWKRMGLESNCPKCPNSWDGIDKMRQALSASASLEAGKSPKTTLRQEWIAVGPLFSFETFLGGRHDAQET